MPMYPGANKNMAVAYYTKGRYNDALYPMEKALRAQPSNTEYRITMGLILMKLGKSQDALHHFEEALRISPTDRDAREARDEALATIRRAK